MYTFFKKRQWVTVCVIVLAFAGSGFAWLLSSKAATAFLSVESEHGVLSSSAARIIDDNTASGGKTVMFGSSPPTSTILFEDDFNGPSGSKFDTTKWHEYSACGYNSTAAYGLIQCGESETLDGQGHLVLSATPTRGQSLMTGDNFRFAYGTASAWIKMPPQAGYWPAFWTLNNNIKSPDANPVGEIDINESYTTWLDSYHAGVHNHDTNANLAVNGGPDYIGLPGTDISSGYHKYTAKVEPNKITFYYDDVQKGQPVVPVAGKTWAFGPNVARGNWLILTLAVGGADGQQTPASQNARMLVDRVEVRRN